MHRLIHDNILVSHSNHMLQRCILQKIQQQAVIDLDALIQTLPQYTWNQIFHAVDQLARSSKIVLRRHRYNYTLFSTAGEQGELEELAN